MSSKPLFLVLLLSLTPPAFASPWHLEATAAADFPVSAGGRLTLEAPFGLQLSGGFGVLPDPYVDAINATLVGLGAYDRATAEVIDTALRQALVWRAQLGWRPFRSSGFYAQAGYGRMTLQGGLSAQEFQALIAGESQGLSAEASATVHLMNVELGWQWVLERHLVLGLALGGAFTLGSHAQVTLEGPARLVSAAAPFVERGEAYFSEAPRSFVHSPVASVRVGWRFF